MFWLIRARFFAPLLHALHSPLLGYISRTAVAEYILGVTMQLLSLCVFACRAFNRGSLPKQAQDYADPNPSPLTWLFARGLPGVMKWYFLIYYMPYWSLPWDLVYWRFAAPYTCQLLDGLRRHVLMQAPQKRAPIPRLLNKKKGPQSCKPSTDCLQRCIEAFQSSLSWAFRVFTPGASTYTVCFPVVTCRIMLSNN